MNKVGVISTAFIKLLVAKGRETNLPEIAAAVEDLYYEIKNIHKVKITTAVKISETLKASIAEKVRAESLLGELDLETVVNEELVGGFILETGGKSIDASILKDLKDIKKQFLNNEYLHNIR